MRKGIVEPFLKLVMSCFFHCQVASATGMNDPVATTVDCLRSRQSRVKTFIFARLGRGQILVKCSMRFWILIDASGMFSIAGCLVRFDMGDDS